jgi:hypothetical protein
MAEQTVDLSVALMADQRVAWKVDLKAELMVASLADSLVD